MNIAKVFKCGNSQAIRIPKTYHTDEKEFIITKLGSSFILRPATDPWSGIRECIGVAKNEPSFQREQTPVTNLPERDWFNVPD